MNIRDGKRSAFGIDGGSSVHRVLDTRDHLGVVDTEDSVTQLLADYGAVLRHMHEERIERGGTPRRWNRLLNQMQALHLRLRATQEGRDSITALICDENPTVRSWSAVNALAWAEDAARAELEREASETDGLFAFEARMTLREHDAGRLNTSWTPTRN